MNIVITGGASGLGKAIASALNYEHHDGTIHIVDAKDGYDASRPEGAFMQSAEVPDIDCLDILINCAGINRISWLEDLTPGNWQEMMNINAMAIWRMTQHYLPALSKGGSGRSGHGDVPGGTVLNIISNASHMPMRGSLAYNASKGAAHIMTLQMARELYDRHDITVFGISPNKLAGTKMSESIDQQVVQQRGWSIEKAREYQLAGLATHEETDPATLAEFIAFLLSTKQRHKFLHGCVIPYGA